MNRAYLSIGSNINPEQNIVQSIKLLADATRVIAVSTIWETLPEGGPNQPNYLNGAVIIETPLSAIVLKQQILIKIEQQLGRVQQLNKFAPRPIDIDIMLFNRDVLQIGQRYIPDAEILERAFVAIPLAELDPTYLHPKTGQTLQEIAQTFTPKFEAMYNRQDISQAVKFLLMDTQEKIS